MAVIYRAQLKSRILKGYQTFQNISLGKLTIAPSYRSNRTLHEGTKIKSINKDAGHVFYK